MPSTISQMNVDNAIWAADGNAPPRNFSPVGLVYLRYVVEEFLLITSLDSTLQLLHSPNLLWYNLLARFLAYLAHRWGLVSSATMKTQFGGPCETAHSTNGSIRLIVKLPCMKFSFYRGLLSDSEFLYQLIDFRCGDAPWGTPSVRIRNDI